MTTNKLNQAYRKLKDKYGVMTSWLYYRLPRRDRETFQAAYTALDLRKRSDCLEAQALICKMLDMLAEVAEHEQFRRSEVFYDKHTQGWIYLYQEEMGCELVEYNPRYEYCNWSATYVPETVHKGLKRDKFAQKNNQPEPLLRKYKYLIHS